METNKYNELTVSTGLKFVYEQKLDSHFWMLYDEGENGPCAYYSARTHTMEESFIKFKQFLNGDEELEWSFTNDTNTNT